MKKTVQLFFVWIGILMVLLTSSVVHHHHGSRMCMVREVCRIDGQIDDRHTSHSANGERDDCSIKMWRQSIETAKCVPLHFHASWYPSLPYFFTYAFVPPIIVGGIDSIFFGFFFILTEAGIHACQKRGPPIG